MVLVWVCGGTDLRGGSVVISILFYALVPVLVRYTTSELGLSMTVAGIMAGLFSVISIVARPWSGYLCDTRNTERIFFVSTVGLGVVIGILIVAKHTMILLIIRAMQGVLYAFSSTACFVLLNRCIPETRLNEGIGYYGVGQILASSLGTSLGIYLTELRSLTVSYLLIGGTEWICFQCILAFYRFRSRCGTDSCRLVNRISAAVHGFLWNGRFVFVCGWWLLFISEIGRLSRKSAPEAAGYA